MTELSALPGNAAAMGETPCRACHHPRRGDGGQASVITSRQALDASSSSCVICGILSRGIRAILASHGAGRGNAAAGTTTEPDTQWLRIDFNRANASPSLDIHIFSSGTALSLFSPTKTAWPTLLLPDLPLGRHIPTSTASPESYAWARNKLLQCQALHKSCRAVRDEALRKSNDKTKGSYHSGGARCGPRRLLDVGEPPDDSVRLVDMASGSHDDIDATFLYAALSHCWGRDPFLQTLSTNIAQHQSPGGIALKRLPLTFREAIDFTRRLGLHYLWIDSLCIVQDDPQDWQSESSRMAAVYQSAHVVISASGAKGASDGLYSDAAGSPLYKAHVERIQIRDQSGRQHDRSENDRDGNVSLTSAPPATGEVAFRRAAVGLTSIAFWTS
ncbi:hypothetical protein NLG97_g10235 [Lecanicillium saksenae]|uniref:Uncharacterized protein n=1 Tax=Lecanicillium saksenae TaxID=468837 RepID=A0ACC1QGS9_9HYPO|nr:hypothetical protein NLG97_g10235 [Lecanicillium saksenae]